MQNATPVKEVSEEARLEKEQQQEKIEMTPVRRTELEHTPEGTPEQQQAEDNEAASPGFGPKTPERPPTK